MEFCKVPKSKVQIQNELDVPHVHQTSISAFEWNLPQPPNFVSCSTQVPNQIELDMCHDKVGGKSYSWDFCLAPSASTPSYYLPM